LLIKDKFTKSNGAWCGLNRPDIKEEEADVVIFGIPYDKGVSYRAGASEGPAVLRENTFESTPYTERFESIEELKVFDGGDFKSENRDDLFKEVEGFVSGLVEKNVFFTMVGGDHSVTIPVQAGIDRALNSQFGIIHIDAHFDLCDTLHDDKYSHGSTERRALELKNIGGTENLYFVGIRSIEPDEYNFKKENKIQVASAFDCHERGIEAIGKEVVAAMKSFDKIYVTIDIDCLDPAFAAGTGTPQFGGLYARQLLTFLRMIFEGLNVIGMDVVEVAPPLDAALTSMFAARKIITECWGYRAKKIGKLKL